MVSSVISDVAARAWHRSGGLCMCGCGRPADKARRVFPAERWPSLAYNPDNVIVVHGGHPWDQKLPRRVTRHARLLAMDERMVKYLDDHYSLQRTTR